jgi:cytochrome subunit of sulfide dehydrogenase
MKASVFKLVLASLAVAGLGIGETATAADVAKIAEDCAACHGKDGASTEPDVPIIGGMSATYLEANLKSYAKKERPCPDTKFSSGPKKGTSTNMCEISKGLGDSDSGSIAKFYASKKFVRAAQTVDADLANKGKMIHEKNCEKCHSSDGSDPKDDAGVLAGQWLPYLKASLEEFSTGKRPMEKKMKPRIDKLDAAAFEALANYYASFK